MRSTHAIKKRFAKFVCKAAILGLALGLAQQVVAQDWPKRPINIIVPYKAGGGTDAYARAISAAAKKVLGVPVTVVNKPGSSGLNGANAVAKARNDGYTMMMTSAGSFLLTTMSKPESGLDAMSSLEFVAQVGQLKTALFVPINSPFKTVQDLIEASKTKTLRWAHTGRGGFHNVGGMGFIKENGVNAQDVPFKGGSPSRAAVIGEQVDFGFIGVNLIKGYEDKLRILGVNSEKRDGIMNQYPSFGELGIAHAPVSSPIIVFAPKGTPKNAIATMEKALKDITASPKFAEILAQRGTGPVYKNGQDAKTALGEMKAAAEPLLQYLK